MLEKARDALLSATIDRFNCRPPEKRNGPAVRLSSRIPRYFPFHELHFFDIRSKIIPPVYTENAIIVATRNRIGNKNDTCGVIRNRM